MSPQAATFRPAIHALYGIVVHGTGYIELRCHKPGEVAIGHHQRIARGGARLLAETVQRFDERFSEEIAMRLPRHQRGFGTVQRSSVLWCRIEGTREYEKALRHKPRPTMVLQEGTSSRRLLLWGLLDSVGWERCVDLNRRLAYRFGARQNRSDPDLLEIPLPGTCLRVGRSRPVPVRVARLTGDVWEADKVAGWLREPPPADAWLKGATA